ncbi:MAG: hypothetical protein WCG45_03370, partial [bacterium]
MRSYTFTEYLKVIGISTINAKWFYRNPWRPIEKTRKYQEKQIKKLLIYAYKNTSLYYNKYNSAGVHPDDFKHLEDLSKFPTITKNEMIAHFSLNKTTNNSKNIKYINSVSSGSSGKIITIMHNPLDTWSYALGRFRILNLLKNYKPWDKSLYIYTSPYPA